MGVNTANLKQLPSIVDGQDFTELRPSFWQMSEISSLRKNSLKKYSNADTISHSKRRLTISFDDERVQVPAFVVGTSLLYHINNGVFQPHAFAVRKCRQLRRSHHADKSFEYIG